MSKASKKTTVETQKWAASMIIMALPGLKIDRSATNVYIRELCKHFVNTKWNGNMLYSEDALAQGAHKVSKGFTDEHAFPMKQVIKLIEDITNVDQMIETLQNLLVVVRVTQGEDSKLNSLGLKTDVPDITDIFSRYKAANIKVVEA